jgi:hypothetical protein
MWTVTSFVLTRVALGNRACLVRGMCGNSQDNSLGSRSKVCLSRSYFWISPTSLSFSDLISAISYENGGTWLAKILHGDDETNKCIYLFNSRVVEELAILK